MIRQILLFSTAVFVLLPLGCKREDRVFDPGSAGTKVADGTALNEVHAGDFLEFFAQVSGADLDELRHDRERKFFFEMILNVRAGFPDFRRLRPIGIQESKVR